MSSSPSLATVLNSGVPVLEEILPFPYSEIASSAVSAAPVNHAGPERSSGEHRDPGQDLAQVEARYREQGRREGEAEARKNFEEQLALSRGNVVQALEQFARERAAFYGKLETEVVSLALSIARKILHREAQIDPLLLAGIVRVTLEKIEGATEVVLLVNPQVAPDWRSYLASTMDPGALPEIQEDASLEPERCILRTAMGTAELGTEVQLKEIETGLMDLLAARPRGEA